jgi:hypothetical protein
LEVELLDQPEEDTVDYGASKRSSQNYSDMYEQGSPPCDEETDTIEVNFLFIVNPYLCRYSNYFFDFLIFLKFGHSYCL